ncbi:putative low-complexity protein [Bradyrhizobium sp. CIR48]|nr:putative low-complexity protein [Bradyrhizobium sp. CIR3A]MBB4429771.1 putative low-complexity protein [Bradyrhizobium sp. CIR48]
MSRIFAVLLVVMCSLVLAVEARAQVHSPAAKMSSDSGQCPTGSCAMDGSAFAKHRKYCSPANCLNNRFKRKQTQ